MVAFVLLRGEGKVEGVFSETLHPFREEGRVDFSVDL